MRLKLFLLRFLSVAIQMPILRPRTNLALLLERLEGLGYCVRHHRLRSDSFNLPQRRVRIYFFGVRVKNRHGMSGDPESVHRMIGELLQCLKCDLTKKPDAASVVDCIRNATVPCDGQVNCCQMQTDQ